MPGTNFEDPLVLDDKGCPLGKGPIEYDASTLYVWISQSNGPGTPQVIAQGTFTGAIGKDTTWQVETSKVDPQSTFAEGPAYGQAIAFVNDDGWKVIQWGQPLHLTRGGGATV